MFDKIQKVDPKGIWEYKTHDFTPWLADNTTELGESIGVELHFFITITDFLDFYIMYCRFIAIPLLVIE